MLFCPSFSCKCLHGLQRAVPSISIFPIIIYYKYSRKNLKNHFKNHIFIFLFKLLFISMFIYFFIFNFSISDYKIFIISGYFNFIFFHIIEGLMNQKILLKNDHQKQIIIYSTTIDFFYFFCWNIYGLGQHYSSSCRRFKKR